MSNSRPFSLLVLVLALLLAACDGGGGDDSDATVVQPTLPTGFEQTQSAFSTSEAATEQPVPTNTRVAPPAGPPTRASGTLVVAASTDITQTGLLDVLVPLFETESGYDVEVLARDSLSSRLAAGSGEADAAIISARETQQAIADNIPEGESAPVLRIDYVLVGPPDDPAQAGQQERMNDGVAAIAATQSPFFSRGESDTRVLELSIWAPADIPAGQPWYRQTGQPMLDALQAAAAEDGYTFSDRWTYLSQRDPLGLDVLVDGDPATIVTYSVVVVDPATHPNVNAPAARAFAAFLARPDIQQIIGEYGTTDLGEPAFIAAG